jgi:integrase
MSGKGLKTGAGSHISLIRDNLLERYLEGFPILKEIVQNADDATNATKLHFGYCPGFPEDDHPLARGPAIFFANDGSFTEDDEWAIRQFGFGYKAGTNTAVGKFGLGIKSVFHWSEAFFFLHINSSKDGAYVQSGDVVNPWSDDNPKFSLHEEWDLFPESTKQRIRQYISPILVTSQSFCLWLPLRREESLHELAPIMKEYPGDKPTPTGPHDAPWGDCSLALAGMIPLLHRIREIHCWMPDSDGNYMVRNYSVVLDSNSTQRHFPRIENDSQRHPIRGRVLISQLSENQSSPTACEFTGIETSLNREELTALRTSEFWPTNRSMDPETGEPRNTPDKPTQHSSVSFVSLPVQSKRRSRLTIFWAVFLPVGEVSESIALDLPYDIQFTLHGYFFLDSGRTDIAGLHDGTSEDAGDEVSLRKVWNATLCRLGLFPLVIPALQHWIAETNANDSTAEALTKALTRSRGISANKMHVTREVQWLYRVRPHGNGSWESVPSGTRIRTIPEPPTSDTMPLEVFPALADLMASKVVTFAGKPNITSSVPASWETELIDQLLESVSVERLLEKTENLRYFVDFLRPNLNDQVWSDSRQLKRVIRKVFRYVPIAKLNTSEKENNGNIKDNLKELVSLLPVTWFIPIPEKNIPLCAEITCYLASSEVGPILVPDSLLEEGHDGPIDTGDLRNILIALGNPPSQLSDLKGHPKSCHVLVLHLLRMSDSGLVLGEEAIRLLPLFYATSCATGNSSLLSLSTISENCRIGAAFTDENKAMAKLLQKVIPNLSILLMDKETYQHACDAKSGRPCNSQTIVDFFQRHKPPLDSPETRAILLSEMLKYENGDFAPEAKRAYRYLLHAKREHYQSDEPLVASGSGAPRDVWAQLYQTILHSKSLLWCYVDSDLANRLSMKQQVDFGLVRAERSTALRLMEKHSDTLHELDLQTFTESERDQILGDFPDTDSETLKCLPIHTTTLGTLTHIDEQLEVLREQPVIHAMVATYIYAGLRREEAIWLTIKDVDFANEKSGVIRIRAKTVVSDFWEPKTKVNRVVPISRVLRAILDAYTRQPVPALWFFPSPREKRWDPDNFSQALRTINRKADLPWSPLDFRHSFGSHLAMKGESLYKISTLMGNSPEICRRHYATLMPEALLQSVEFDGDFAD